MSEEKHSDESKKKPLTERETFNVVTDTVTGPNLRFRDNLYQALAVVVGIVLGIVIGYFSVADQSVGVLVGAFLGLLAGVFVSGLFLMIYRAIRHSRGKHD